MDPGPPDGKRPRLSSWSVSAPQPSSLPHPHSHHHPPPAHTISHPHQHPHGPAAQLPPPPHAPPHQGHPHHHPVATSYQAHPPRPADLSSAPPTPGPVHGQLHHHQDVDRRHHDQEPLAPMHDPYRQQQQQQQPPPQQQQQQQQQHQVQQPPSPAHPSYHPYPPRGSVIKREPEDPRRPSSTGHAPESLPPTQAVSTSLNQQPPPPSQSSYQENQPRHMNYDNSQSVPPTPGGYRAPSYPPPTPISHQNSYEQQSGYQSNQEPFYSVYSSSVSKKKNTRASQACDQCRQLKAKCDETKPCKTCRDKGTECKYRDPVPKATDKAQADILDGISGMQNTLQALMDRFVNMDDRLTKMESVFTKNPNAIPPIKPEPHHEAEFKESPVSPYPRDGQPMNRHFSHDASRDQAVVTTEHMPLPMMTEDDLEAEPGPVVPPGEPAIPINHTTLAGLLLDWPSIKDLAKPHLDSQGVRYISEYPIGIEQNRGLLKVYGRGEDSARHAREAREFREAVDHGVVDMSDDLSDVASPSPAADWGQLGGLSPGDQVEYRGGVLGFDGNPDFTEAKVWSYVESFKTNILNMHPIIQPKVLDDWVQAFLDDLPVSNSRSLKPFVARSGFAVGGGSQYSNEATGSKRKRSPGPDNPSGTPVSCTARAGKPNRSIHSALILTILALGKVCLFRDHIPDVFWQSDPLPQGSPVIRNGVPPSPTQGSPPSFSSHSQSSGLPSPKEQERGHQSRRSSIHGPGGIRMGYSLKKNYEVIPGLEYFAFATDILGNHTGAYRDMKNVYANIFAGLYHGQLGRPLESFAFIHKASHKLQVIMRPSLDRMRKLKRNAEFIQDTKYNNLALAFWTCLQLESDLIAELQLPPSGLLSYEDDMPHPNMSLLQGFNQRILDSYPGQLYLRTHLNSIHRMFYSPETPNSKGKEDKFRNVRLVADAVSGMHWVAPSFAFREDDAPADDILAARLRAKYWGAQVITYRPFIRQILQFSYRMKTHPSSPNLSIPSEFRDGIIAPYIHPKTRVPSELDPLLLEMAKKGIKALIESTRAFHGLGDKRPVITNVFGTAHAQWGNLLVLSAAFKDPILCKTVDEDLLRMLFNKTIAFFRQSATATSSLRSDMHILEGLQRDLFGIADGRTNSSFSSNTTTLHTPKLPMAAPPHMSFSLSDSGMTPQIPSQQQHIGLSQGQ